MIHCFIRFDASAIIGFGHWYRCIALYEALKEKKLNILILIHDPSSAIRDGLYKKKISFVVLKDVQSADELIQLKNKYNCHLLIIDLMNLNEKYVCKVNAEFETVSIGGSGNGLNLVDVRIEGMLQRNGYTENFIGKELYVGMQYIILRTFFIRKQKKHLNELPLNILVLLGGDANATGCIVGTLVKKLFPETNVLVVVGKLTDIHEQYKDINLVKDVDNPSIVMKHTDLAFCSGGMTMFELLYLKVPFIIVPQIYLQEEIARSYKDAGIADYISLEDQKESSIMRISIQKKIMALYSKEKRIEFQRNIPDMLDGRGLQRIVDIIYSRIH